MIGGALEGARRLAGPAGKWAPGVGAFVLLAAGAWMRLSAGPAVPLFEWDTRGWLDPALSWLGGGPFQESCEREWIYAAFLAACLEFGGGFSAVVWCQWIFGLAGGVLLWLTWRMWMGMLPGGGVVRAAAVVFGWLALAAYVLNPNLVVFEMSLRPEAVLGVAVLAGLFLATGFVRARWLVPGPWRAEAWGLLLPSVAAVVVTLKPSWALTFPVFVAPLVLACAGPWRRVPGNSRPLVLGAVVAAACVELPGRVVFERGDEARVVLPMTLLTIHADAVLPALAAERDDSRTSAARRELLATAVAHLERDLAASREVPIYYHRLGFDPDFIMYRAGLFPYLASARGFGKAELAEFCNRAYIEAWKREPVRMLRKIFMQMGYFAFPDARTYSKRSVDLRALTAESLEVAGEGLGEEFGGRAREVSLAYLQDLRSAAEVERSVRAWRPLDQFLRKWVPPVLGAGIFLLVLTALSFVVPVLKPLRIACLMAVFYFAIPAANALTVSIAHALDNNRYRMSYGPVVFFAICATGAVGVAAVGTGIRVGPAKS